MGRFQKILALTGTLKNEFVGRDPRACDAKQIASNLNFLGRLVSCIRIQGGNPNPLDASPAEGAFDVMLRVYGNRRILCFAGRTGGERLRFRPVIDDSSHGNAGIHKLVRQPIAPVVVGDYHGSVPRTDEISVHEALQTASQKNPRKIVVFKDHWIFVAAGCNDDVVRSHFPEFALTHDG